MPDTKPGTDLPDSLLEPPDGAPRASLFLPLDTAPTARHATELAYRGLVSRAQERLRAVGFPEEQVESLGAELARREADVLAVRTPDRAAAVFASPGGSTCVPLADGAPESARVGQSFALRPLIAALDRERRFLVLAVSVNRVELFAGDARSLSPLPLGDVPGSLAEALGAEVQGEPLQQHSSKRGGTAPIYHGQGGAKDERSVDLARFHVALARPLRKLLHGHAEPVVLVADAIHQGPLRELLGNGRLLPRGVTGSPDRLSREDLHASARACAQSITADREDVAAAQEAAASRGKALWSLDEVLRATMSGRVHRLWVASDDRVPGLVDRERIGIAQGRGDDDVLDDLAAIALRNGGVVRVVERAHLSAGAPSVAELR